ncbi:MULTISPECIES: IS91 family transposase [Pseudomonas]|uniref:IS91 family transposase n=1 Tax=Pseudomonas quercus TaxID=2722792 RepID=A0ABX0YID3_9PSED|nr:MULTISPECIES: IS91 family transposase [Pseudomonas]MBF7144670.1 IS91 family transposase [Pseudomonas sp. LY10J]NJP03208.1 IS91 family transposase [Pseudomonas quercus]
MASSFKPRPLKHLFTANGCWAGLLEAGGLRDIEVESVSKMLACGTSILGVKHYTCANERCPHVKYLCNTCHCRACPSCGKKATDQWIAVQHNRLPDCAWYHPVFTLLDTLWPLFFHNRGLLDALCRLAADNLLYAGKRRGLHIGLFGAIHTYGRRLNWHPHVHISATAGGLDEQDVWKNIAFHEKAMRRRWMWNVRNHLLEHWGQIKMPPELAHITCESDWRNLVLNAGGQHWHIYLSKKTENGRKTVNYLGRYLKKPPISGSRLAHYTSGPSLSFTYLDHRTQTYQKESLSQANMLRRVVQHIPEKHFRMIRYFGFLANRVCGQYLPKVYEALEMTKPGPTPKLYFAQMAKAFLNVDPFSCVLCGANMVYTAAISGLTVKGLVTHAHAIAQMRYVKP